MKVCLIKYDMTEKSGGERVCSILSRELCDYFDVYVVSICGKGEPPYYSLDERVNYTALLQGHRRIRKTLVSGSRAVRKYVKENGIDVLLSVGGNVNAFMWAGSAFRNVKKIFCEHINLKMANEDKMNKILRRIGVKIADKIITLTHRDRDEYIKTYSLPENRVDCIYNWVDDKLINSTSNYDINSKKIITVGRFEHQKGYDMLIEVAKKVFEKHPDWHWDIYGDGELYNETDRQINECGLNQNLHLMGTSNKIYQLYPDYAMYVMTSRLEGLPMVLLEAKANRLPCVSFDCLTGPCEIIEDKVSGYLAKPNDISALSNHICELIENPDRRLEFSAHARDNIDLFNKKEIVDKWVKLIKSL